jgi:Helix-turn-helix.
MCGLGSDRLALNPALAGELRSARLHHGLSQRQVADHVGVSNQFISMLEHAERAPSGWVAANLTRVLRLDAWTAAGLQRVAETVDERRRVRRDAWRDQHGCPPAEPGDTSGPTRKRLRRRVHDALLYEALGYAHRDAFRRKAREFMQAHPPLR